MSKAAISAALLLLIISVCDANASDGRSGAWHTAAQGAPSLKASQKAVELNPQDAVANNDLGWAFRQNGDLTQAEKYLRDAIKLNPRLAQAHSNLSVVLVDKGALDEAQAEGQQAVAIDPGNPIYKVVL